MLSGPLSLTFVIDVPLGRVRINDVHVQAGKRHEVLKQTTASGALVMDANPVTVVLTPRLVRCVTARVACMHELCACMHDKRLRFALGTCMMHACATFLTIFLAL